MHDRGRALFGDARLEEVVHLVDGRHAAPRLRRRRLELAVPALELSLDVALVTRQVGKPDRLKVDGVYRGERVDDRLADAAALLGREHLLGRRGVAHDRSLDELHDVERCAVDGVVRAQADGHRHRYRGGAERGDEAMLAGHVVGGGEHVAHRRSTQDPLRTRWRR